MFDFIANGVFTVGAPLNAVAHFFERSMYNFKCSIISSIAAAKKLLCRSRSLRILINGIDAALIFNQLPSSLLVKTWIVHI